MNIYTADFIKGSYELTGVHYDANRSRHSESMYMTFKKGKDNKESKHYFAHNVPLSSLWMQLLDYDHPEAVASADVFKTLRNCEDKLPVRLIKDPRKLKSYLERFTEDDFDTLCADILPTFEETIRLKPALGFLYPSLHIVLSTIFNFVCGALSVEQCSSLLAIKEDHIRNRFECKI